MVLEAISDGSSSAGLRARELCLRAAIEQAQRETEETGKEEEPSRTLYSKAALRFTGSLGGFHGGKTYQ